MEPKTINDSLFINNLQKIIAMRIGWDNCIVTTAQSYKYLDNTLNFEPIYGFGIVGDTTNTTVFIKSLKNYEGKTLYYLESAHPYSTKMIELDEIRHIDSFLMNLMVLLSE